MNEKIREIVLNGGNPKKEWTLGKFRGCGVTKDGFPWVWFETTNFGSVLVGKSKDGKEPKSKLRNDARSGIACNNYEEASRTAERMSKEIVY